VASKSAAPSVHPATPQAPPDAETACRRLPERRPARLLQRLGLLHLRGRTRLQPAHGPRRLPNRRPEALAVVRARRPRPRTRLASDVQSDSGTLEPTPQEVVAVRTRPAITAARITANGADTRASDLIGALAHDDQAATASDGHASGSGATAITDDRHARFVGRATASGGITKWQQPRLREFTTWSAWLTCSAGSALWPIRFTSTCR